MENKKVNIIIDPTKDPKNGIPLPKPDLTKFDIPKTALFQKDKLDYGKGLADIKYFVSVTDQNDILLGTLLGDEQPPPQSKLISYEEFLFITEGKVEFEKRIKQGRGKDGMKQAMFLRNLRAVRNMKIIEEKLKTRN